MDKVRSQKRKRGRKPTKVDIEARLQRSRQSARECRARKKMRYKFLEDIVSQKEKDNLELRSELKECLRWYKTAKSGGDIPEDVLQQFKEEIGEEPKEKEEEQSKEEGSSTCMPSMSTIA